MAALRGLGPFDAALCAATGNRDLPPLWLRRHAGSVADYEGAARGMDSWIGRLELVRPGDLALDVGCGAGAMATALGRRIGPNGHYVGVDVHQPSIAWAARHFSGDGRFRFELAQVASPYGSHRGPSSRHYRLPLGDGAAQFVLAKSLFTHLLEEEAAAYLAEFRRVLDPGRAVVVSAFLFAPGSRSDRGLSRWFRHPEAGSPVRWRFRHRPQAAVAYERSRFVSLVESAGLRVHQVHQGFFPGEDEHPHGQDIVLLGI